jgi:hypothetical protein
VKHRRQSRRWALSGGLAIAGIGGVGGSFLASHQADAAYGRYLELPAGSSQDGFDAQYGTYQRWTALRYVSLVTGSILILSGGFTFYFGG